MGGIFVDAIVVEVRDGHVRNTPFYVVMGVTVNGERDILRIWAGDGAEGARFRLQVFSEAKNRGVENVLIAVCDGLKGSPEAIERFRVASSNAAVVAISPLIHRTYRHEATPQPDQGQRSLPYPGDLILQLVE